MNIWTIVVIAIALAMDAFAVSIASGICIRHSRIKHALIMGAWFGAFQAIMPLIGWLAGVKFSNLISTVDHWIALGLLGFVGGKMIYESSRLESLEKKTDPFALKILFVLSLATSIDALAVGLSFALLKVEILLPVLIIGIVTFLISFAGVLIGERGGHFFEKKIELIGGLILIAIGIKIVLDHVL